MNKKLIESLNHYPRNMTGYGSSSIHPQWPNKARVALQFVLNYEEGGENCILHGDKASEAFLSEIVGAKPYDGVRHMSMESFYEYGSRVGVWRVLRLFREFEIPITIFAVAVAIARNQELADYLIDEGYDICAHGLRWIDYQFIDEKTEREHIKNCISLLTDFLGKRPLGWYTGRNSPNTRRLVIEEGGFLYDSDSYDDDLPYWVEGKSEKEKHLVIPYTLDVNDMRFATPQGFNSGEQFFNYLKDSFDALYLEGVTIILITHKLREIMSITDYVSVMRAGKMVAHRQTSETNPEELAELMIGRKVLLNIVRTEAKSGDPLLVANNLEIYNEQGIKRVSEVSFEARSGEILGIAGVTGNGQGTLLKALAGILPLSKGSIEILGETISPKRPLNPQELRNLGVAHVPEDRQRMGIISDFSASESALLGYQNDNEINQGVWLKRSLVKANCESIMEAFDVRPTNPDLKSSNFSGGNQQKLILAREFERDPEVLIIGQPTRGVDIGAIEFIRKRIIEMRDAGKAIILISVELEEIMSISDRIIVMCDGEITGTVDASDADEATLGMMMANALISQEKSNEAQL